MIWFEPKPTNIKTNYSYCCPTTTARTSTREDSPLGKVSLYRWSPVLQAWIQQLHYIRIKNTFLFLSDLVLLKWRPAVQWSFSQQWVFSASTIPLIISFQNVKEIWAIATSRFHLSTFQIRFREPKIIPARWSSNLREETSWLVQNREFDLRLVQTIEIVIYT